MSKQTSLLNYFGRKGGLGPEPGAIPGPKPGVPPQDRERRPGGKVASSKGPPNGFDWTKNRAVLSPTEGPKKAPKKRRNKGIFDFKPEKIPEKEGKKGVKRDRKEAEKEIKVALKPIQLFSPQKPIILPLKMKTIRKQITVGFVSCEVVTEVPITCGKGSKEKEENEAALCRQLQALSMPWVTRLLETSVARKTASEVRASQESNHIKVWDESYGEGDAPQSQDLASKRRTSGCFERGHNGNGLEAFLSDSDDDLVANIGTQELLNVSHSNSNRPMVGIDSTGNGTITLYDSKSCSKLLGVDSLGPSNHSRGSLIPKEETKRESLIDINVEIDWDDDRSDGDLFEEASNPTTPEKTPTTSCHPSMTTPSSSKETNVGNKRLEINYDIELSDSSLSSERAPMSQDSDVIIISDDDSPQPVAASTPTGARHPMGRVKNGDVSTPTVGQSSRVAVVRPLPREPSSEQETRQRAVHFLDLEALDESGEVDEEEGTQVPNTYDQKFINDESEFGSSFVNSQADESRDMREVYLRSLGSQMVGNRNKVKLQYNYDRNENVYSQAPTAYERADYAYDSFCVADDHIEYISPVVARRGRTRPQATSPHFSSPFPPNARKRRRIAVSPASSSDDDKSAVTLKTN